MVGAVRGGVVIDGDVVSAIHWRINSERGASTEGYLRHVT